MLDPVLLSERESVIVAVPSVGEDEPDIEMVRVRDSVRSLVLVADSVSDSVIVSVGTLTEVLGEKLIEAVAFDGESVGRVSLILMLGDAVPVPCV